MNITLDIIHDISHAVTIFNTFFMVFVIFYVASLMKKVNRLFEVNASNIIDASEAVFKKQDNIVRWLKLIAKMINEDREGLQEHDTKVNKLMEAALRIEKAIPLERETPHQ